MKDNYGDALSVGTSDGNTVEILVSEGYETCTAILTPKKARKFALLILSAADEAERGSA